MGGGIVKKIGRPLTYTDDTRVRLLGMPTHRINSGTLREAVVVALMEMGEASIAELTEKIGSGAMMPVRGLLRNGWLEVVE